MRVLLPLPVLLPLLAAAVSILVGRSRRWQRIVSITTLTAVVGIAVAILVIVDRDGVVATQAGDWPAPLGISLVADRFSAVMLVVASVVLLAVVIYAVGQPGAERNHVGFQSVYLVLAAGVAASFLTGDLFNLFVAIEMMLTASYVLITLGGRLDQVRSGMTYVVISLVASILFLAALAFTYAATGTVNLADLSGRIAELPDGVQGGLAGLFLVVFGIKAGLFPLYFWLPDSYPTAPSPVTAIFAGLLTKVGVYAIIRTQTLLFPGVLPTWLVMTVAGATMIVGVLGAIAQDDVKRILSFHIISHIGYMLMGLGIATVAGLAGAVFYTVHHILVKTTLFLTGGLIEHSGGSSRLSKLGDMVRSSPIIAVLFLVPALSLAGIPPMSGFVAKLSLVDAAAEERQWAMVVVSVGVSLLTVFALMKIWTGVFWAPVAEDDDGEPHSVPVADAARSRMGGPALMVLPTAVLALGTVVLGLASGPLYDLSTRAAEDLVDPQPYVTAVLDPDGSDVDPAAHRTGDDSGRPDTQDRPRNGAEEGGG